MSKDSSTKRIFTIIKEMQKGRVLKVENLAQEFDVSVRTIRRDFALIKEVFGNCLITPTKGEYAMISRDFLENILDTTEMYLLKNIFQLAQNTNLTFTQNVDSRVKTTLQDSDISPYLFKTRPYEEMFYNKKIFKVLENAIRFRKKIKITYENLGVVTHFSLMPYKIVFISENFYLASMQEKRETFLLSRIALIKDVEVSAKSFNYNYEVMEFIAFMQSPWAVYKPNFKKHLIKVIIEIPKQQSKYFLLKKFLPSQEFVCKNDDGSMQFSYLLTSQNEILATLKQWIPFIKVIVPDSLKVVFDKIKTGSFVEI